MLIRLRRELARQCWTATDLARAAGVSVPTVTAALAGRPNGRPGLRLCGQFLDEGIVEHQPVA